MEYYLRQIHHGIKDPVDINLKQSEIVVGRSTNPQLKKYIQLSRQHARFKKVNDVWFVEDLKSLNGVFVNGNKIGQNAVRLEIGDHIGLGIPAAAAECDGYVCSLTVRPVKREILVVDLCDDTPVIKTEPPDDVPSSSRNDIVNSSNQLVNNISSSKSTAANTSAIDTHLSNSHKNALNRRSDRVSLESSSHNPVSNTLSCQHSANTVANPFEKSAVASESSASFISVQATTKSDNYLNSSSSTNKLTVVDPSSAGIQKSPVNTTKTTFSFQEGLSDSYQRTLAERDTSKIVKQNSESAARRSSVQSNDISSHDVNREKRQNLSKMQEGEQSVNRSQLLLSTKNAVKECHVSLVRCDSEYFKWPSDLKKPTTKEDTSTKKKSFVRTNFNRINKRVLSSDSSSSSDDEGKQNWSKPPVKTKKVSEFASSSKSLQSNSNACNRANTSSDKNKSIINNDKEENIGKRVYSRSFKNGNSGVLDLPVLENEIKKVNDPPDISSKSPFDTSMEHVNNIGQNENLAENAANKEIDKANDILDNMGYSQPDEDGVIVISDDDEEYMDFNSCHVFIKQEPLDDETELNGEVDMFGQITDIEGIPDALNSDETFSESIENIKRFVESTHINKDENQMNRLQASENVGVETFFPMSQLNEEDSEISSNNSKSTKVISPKVMKSSISTFREEEIDSESDASSDGDSSVSSHHSLIIAPSFDKNKKESKELEKSREVIQKQVEEVKSKGSKSVGRALLIEPQKLNRRPTRLCGRGEWFEDKASEQALEPDKLEKSKEPKRLTRSKEPPKTKTSSRKKQESTRQSLLSKLQSPNKHVADRVVPQSARKKLSRPAKKISEKPAPEVRPLKESSTAKKKNPPISRRPNEFASRSAFLVSDMQPVTAKRKPGNQNKQVDLKESAKNATSSRPTHPVPNNIPNPNNVSSKSNNVPSKPSYVPNNKGYPVPSSVQPSVMKKTLNVGFGSLHQSKTVPAVIVPPLKTTSLPSTSRAFSEANVAPYGYSAVRDPRLRRTLSSTDNNSAMNENYASRNQMNNATNVRNRNYSDNNFPQRSTNSSNMPHGPVGISANLPQPAVSQNTLPLSVTPGNYQPLSNTHSLRYTSQTFNQNNTGISFEVMIKRMVEMNVKWLEEQKKCDRPPPQVLEGASNLPLYFNTVDQYISSFFPMIVLETWDNIYQESKVIFESENKRAKRFYYVVSSTESKSDMTIYNCEALINKTVFGPSEGNLLLMDVRDTTKLVSPRFGYVFRHSIEDIKSDTITAEWQKVGQIGPENAKLWRFSVYLKNRKITPMFQKLMKGNVICSIKNRLRLADALKSFALSPLNQLIIQPNENDFYLKYPDVSPGIDYNYSQMMAIQGIGSEMLRQDPKPKIILLQGPPGTGKTHTIIGLLEKLSSSEKFRVLVVAPSNAAIDEIGSRLVYLNRANSRNQARIRFVRVGLPDQINTKLKPYTLDEKASKLLKEYEESTRKTIREENEKLRKQIAELKKHKQDYSIEKKIKIYQEELKKGEEKLTAKTVGNNLLWSFKAQVLRESNIILSTLGSCVQSILISCFGPRARENISCCIMDEASQCTETEALLPLKFGISKLIMVGDHQQLPATVSSKAAAACGYERSMFERFHLYFSKHCNFNPIYMLSTQYRMHSEICQFPAKHFYDNLLLTEPHNDIRDLNFPFHPYIVYDIADSQESDSSNSKTNSSEAHAIVDICSQILNIDSRSSIGIITPYQAQRTLYSQALGHNRNYKHIEVNTVDGFQGREKDIIILSCVRAGSGGIGFLSCPKRLNVAITRASKCLIICVHSRTLVQNEDWRKLIDDARNRHLCISINSYKDMQLMFRATMMRESKSKRKH